MVAATATGSLLDPLSLITPARTIRSFSRKQLAFLISQGHVLVIHRQLVYRLNGWLAKHPGNHLSILHFVGRDATDEIEAYHPVFALSAMRNWCVGRVEEADWDENAGWRPLVPPTQLGVWSTSPQAYAGVPKLDDTLSLMKLHEDTGYPTSGSPPGTTFPFLAMEQLEPAAPPAGIDPIEQQRLSVSWRKLRHEVLQVEGLFEYNPLSNYKFTIMRCTALFISFLASYLYATRKLHYAWSAVSLGFFMHQIMFVAHDLGHKSGSSHRALDRYVGATIAAWASGISIGWWIDQHDVHHLVTNHPEHDPDIQLLPTFAFTPRFFTNVYSTFHSAVLEFDPAAQFFVKYQHLFFYPIMVVARFSLFGKSYHYLLTKAKPDWFRTYEMVGVVFFWTYYTTLLKYMTTANPADSIWFTRFMFSLIVLMTVCPIHIQIVLSHSAQDNEDMGVYECFVHRQLRTTMDVSCPEWLDFVHGGLQMQVTHHLFPRLPRGAQLRKATALVKAWALENNIEFKEKSFTEGNAQMVGMLGEIAGQCRALLDTAADESKKGGFPHL